MSENQSKAEKEDARQLLHELMRREQRQRHLEAAILGAVRVLEETKRSFKSKRLAELRQELMDVLGKQQ